MVGRRLFFAGVLAAAASAPFAPAAEAAEVVVPPQEGVCRVIGVPAFVNLGAFVKKQITVGGVILNLDVNQKVLVVEKHVAVRVCVNTEGDAFIADIELDVNGEAQCPDGAVGVALRPRLNLVTGRDGGAVNVGVGVAVTDRDQIGDIAFDEMRVVIDEQKRVEIPPMEVTDEDGADLDVCVGPVTGL